MISLNPPHLNRTISCLHFTEHPFNWVFFCNCFTSFSFATTFFSTCEGHLWWLGCVDHVKCNRLFWCDKSLWLVLLCLNTYVFPAYYLMDVSSVSDFVPQTWIQINISGDKFGVELFVELVLIHCFSNWYLNRQSFCIVFFFCRWKFLIGYWLLHRYVLGY